MSPFEIVMLVIQMIRLALDYCIHLGKARKAQRLAQGRTILFTIRVKIRPVKNAAQAAAGKQAATAEHIMKIKNPKESTSVKKAG